MKEVRDIKLDILMGKQNPIVNLFNQITSGIKIINCNVYNEDGLEFIYFAPAESSENSNKDGQWIFYQDFKNEKFWTNYYKYWTLFESNFSLEYLEIQAITKYLVEEALKREVSTPHFLHRYTSMLVEETLKREVSTPKIGELQIEIEVEETLKREVGTPTAFYKGKLSFSVEEALKREVGKPRCSLNTFHHRVEEALKREISPPSYNSKGKKRRVI